MSHVCGGASAHDDGGGDELGDGGGGGAAAASGYEYDDDGPSPPEGSLLPDGEVDGAHLRPSMPSIFQSASCAEHHWPAVRRIIVEDLIACGRREEADQFERDANVQYRLIAEFDWLISWYFDVRTMNFVATLGAAFGLDDLFLRCVPPSPCASCHSHTRARLPRTAPVERFTRFCPDFRYEFAKQRGQIHSHALWYIARLYERIALLMARDREHEREEDREAADCARARDLAELVETELGYTAMYPERYETEGLAALRAERELDDRWGAGPSRWLPPHGTKPEPPWWRRARAPADATAHGGGGGSGGGAGDEEMGDGLSGVGSGARANAGGGASGGGSSDGDVEMDGVLGGNGGAIAPVGCDASSPTDEDDLGGFLRGMDFDDDDDDGGAAGAAAGAAAAPASAGDGGGGRGGVDAAPVPTKKAIKALLGALAGDAVDADYEDLVDLVLMHVCSKARALALSLIGGG